jgi:hypothetical protein
MWIAFHGWWEKEKEKEAINKQTKCKKLVGHLLGPKPQMILV